MDHPLSGGVLARFARSFFTPYAVGSNVYANAADSLVSSVVRRKAWERAPRVDGFTVACVLIAILRPKHSVALRAPISQEIRMRRVWLPAHAPLVLLQPTASTTMALHVLSPRPEDEPQPFPAVLPLAQPVNAIRRLDLPPLDERGATACHLPQLSKRNASLRRALLQVHAFPLRQYPAHQPLHGLPLRLAHLLATTRRGNPCVQTTLTGKQPLVKQLG